eukprot:gene4101-5130_t
MQLCSICNKDPSKYSCPKCPSIKYCSAACSNKHKELVNNHIVEPTPEITTTTANDDDANNNNNNTSNNDVDTKSTSTATQPTTSYYSSYLMSKRSGSNNQGNNGLHFYKKVTDEQFKQLDESKYIQGLLDHKDLKKLILSIDEQPFDNDRIDLLNQYRKNIPEFNEFVLKVLATIDTLDNLSIDHDGNLISKNNPV